MREMTGVNTTIFQNPAIRSMRALVLSMIDRLEWRHHGIGVLQGYVREHSEPEIRVHVWSRKLLKSGMDLSGDVHDHRFDMVSHVLCGFVRHEELVETPDPEGDHTMMALTHARAAADTNYHGPTTPLGGRFSVERRMYLIREGWSYTFPAQKFHHSPLPDESPAPEVAVTCVEKHRQQDAPARLLYPINRDPVMAFGHTPNTETIKSVLSFAKARLLQ
jgi:hypothetical protein